MFPFHSLSNYEFNSLLSSQCSKICDLDSNLKSVIDNNFPNVSLNDCSFDYYTTVQLNNVVNKF